MILMRKTEGRKLLGRPRHMWVDNIKMGLREIGWSGVDCTVMNLRVTYIFEKFLSSRTIGDFSRRAQLHEVC
jgi:hypothetical protein